jgi:hypothetical protein
MTTLLIFIDKVIGLGILKGNLEEIDSFFRSMSIEKIKGGGSICRKRRS